MRASPEARPAHPARRRVAASARSLTHTTGALAIRAPRRLAPGSAEPVADPGRPPLVIGCGALANELVELTRRAGLPAMDLTCLPASLHNRPERIPGAVAARIRRARADGYERIFVAYADCGTGGRLDAVLEAEGVARLEGAHCYEVYAGRAAFAALADEEPGTFYLTDFLARNFERLVIRGLGLDRHPELLPMYFGNYRRLVYLAQSDDATLTALAESGAGRLGLAFERRFVGLGELAPAIASFATAPVGAFATAGTGSPPLSSIRPTYEGNELVADRAGFIRARYDLHENALESAPLIRPTYDRHEETVQSVPFIRPTYERPRPAARGSRRRGSRRAA